MPKRTPSRRKAVAVSIIQVKLTLARVRPPIWRRLCVRSDATLHDLHVIFQQAMGWCGGHLHAFEIGEERFSSPAPDCGVDIGEMDCTDGHHATIGDVLPRAGAKFTYEYDFGDGWVHQCVVESIRSAPPGAPLAICVTGKRACPPEDCGGPWGYAELLELHSHPNKADPDGRREWLGVDFDPAAFDLGEVNQVLSELGASA